MSATACWCIGDFKPGEHGVTHHVLYPDAECPAHRPR